MAIEVRTVDEFDQALKNPLNRGRAYKVPRSVFDHYVARISVDPITEEQADELSTLLGKKIHASPRLGLTRTFKCQSCGHTFTFADHFRAAMEAGVHSKADLTEFTDPALDYAYLVIDTDEPIHVKCVNCGGTVIGPRCCYTTRSYAYV